MRSAGYRFLLPADLMLPRLVMLLRPESLANEVGPLLREGQVSSLKTVPPSLLEYDARAEFLGCPPFNSSDPALHDDMGEIGDEAVIDVESRLDLRGWATNIFGFHPDGLPTTVLSLVSPSLSLFDLSDSGSSIMVLSCLPRPCRGGEMYVEGGRMSMFASTGLCKVRIPIEDQSLLIESPVKGFQVYVVSILVGTVEPVNGEVLGEGKTKDSCRRPATAARVKGRRGSVGRIEMRSCFEGT